MIRVGQILTVKKPGNRTTDGVASGHGFRVGDKIEIERINNRMNGAYDDSYTARSLSSNQRYTIHRNEIDEGNYNEQSINEHIEEIKGKIEDLHEEIAKFETYKNIMKENSLTEIDEDSIELSRVMDTLKEETNPLKKAVMLKEYLSNPTEYMKKQKKAAKKAAKTTKATKTKQSKETV